MSDAMHKAESPKRSSRRSAGYLFRRTLDLAAEKLLLSWSTLCLRLKCLSLGLQCGRGVKAYGRVILRSPGAGIEIGDGVILVSSSWRCSSAGLAHPVRLRTFSPEARIIVESGVGLNGTSITARSRTVRIGCGAMIGPDCLIMDSDFHSVWPPESRNRYDDSNDNDVMIGKNVWIGARCIVLKGVHIGENSVVAAGSVVTKSIPPNVLVAGNPARVLRQFVELEKSS